MRRALTSSRLRSGRQIEHAGSVDALGSAAVARHGADAYLASFAACIATIAALGVLFLFPYVTSGFRYPLGWDAAMYVWRGTFVAYGGLEEFGTIRAGTPLLLAVLSRATGQSVLTLVALVPALLAAVAGLGAAAMVRATFGIRPMWVPVIGFVTWAAFGNNGMMNLHLDNLLNAALVLAGFAAALAFVAGGSGALAATLLFMAAGLAHWPFYVFAMGVYLLSIAASAWPGRSRDRDDLSWDRGRPLLGAAAASGLFVGLTFLSTRESGWVGARLTELQRYLQGRFVLRLRDWYRYYAFPLAAVGALVAATLPSSPGRRAARRFFLSATAAWILLTLLGGIAQLAGLPTAGARLLQFLFPVPILTGVMLWWAGGRLARLGRVLGLAAAAALVLATLIAFGGMTWEFRAAQRPWIEEEAVKQIASSKAYVSRIAPSRRVVYLLGSITRDRPSWRVIHAILGPDEAARIAPYYGPPADYLAGSPSRRRAGTRIRRGSDVAIIIERYNPSGFRMARASSPERVTAPGVLVLRGPVPPRPLPTTTFPAADTALPNIVWTSMAVTAILFLAGSGWALAVLPRDAVLRVALAPGLGLAVVTLTALGWDRIGQSFAGRAALTPLAIAFAGGYVFAVVNWIRRRGPEGADAVPRPVDAG